MSQILIKFSQPKYKIISYHIIAKTNNGPMSKIDSRKTMSINLNKLGSMDSNASFHLFAPVPSIPHLSAGYSASGRLKDNILNTSVSFIQHHSFRQRESQQIGTMVKIQFLQAFKATGSLAGVCTDPIELNTAQCTMSYCLSSLYSEIEIYNSFQSLLSENGNI